ncbi:unnamed protein product [Orchesella dallaii]|uniref:Tudor domain-containing protein n=1 Tax=Orchesella dallaii TaxID=48710 RepID=A0ABP1QDC7_9HEXA
MSQQGQQGEGRKRGDEEKPQTQSLEFANTMMTDSSASADRSSNVGTTTQLGRGRGRGRGMEKKINEFLSMKNVEDEEAQSETSSITSLDYLRRKWKVNPKYDSSGSENGSQTPPECGSVRDEDDRRVVGSRISYTSREAPVRKLFPVSHFLPRYTEAVKHPKRIEALKSCKVTVLDVNEEGDLMVAFQDNDSVERFARLLDYMGRFYSTKVGFDFQIPIDLLQVGEIVATIIHKGDGVAMTRRVKILEVLKQYGDFKAYALDIDDYNYYYVKLAFALHPVFYRHPKQACKLQLTNLRDMCPKNVFDEFFDHQQKFNDVVDGVSRRILISMIGQNLHVSNLQSSFTTSNDFVGELDFRANWGLHQRFVEEICKLEFAPTNPKESSRTKGVIAYIFPTGEISMCTNIPLFKGIDRIINETKVKQLAENVTIRQQNELMRQIRTGECSLFLMHDDKTNRIVRAKVKSFHEEKLKVCFIDMDREEFQYKSKLICSLTRNSAVPPILSAIPGQAVRLRLAGVDQVRRNREFYQKMVGLEVEFKVCNAKGLSCTEFEFEGEAESKLTLNEILK